MTVRPSTQDAATAWSRIVAGRVRRLRRLRGLSAQQLANGMTRRGFRITRAAIAQVENGYRRHIPIDLVVAFAGFFEVPVTALIDAEATCAACGDDPPVGYRCLACGSWAGMDKEPG